QIRGGAEPRPGGDHSDDDQYHQRDDQPEVPTPGAGQETVAPRPARAPRWGRIDHAGTDPGGLGPFRDGLAGTDGPVGSGSAHAACPLITRSSTPCSSICPASPEYSTRPSAITITRSANPSTSSISLDTTNTAMPESANCRITA